MNLSISNIAWKPAENLQVAGVLKELGIGGIEAAPGLLFGDNPAPADVRRARDFWNENGLRIVALQSLLFGHPELKLFGDKESRRKLADRLLQVREWAFLLGAGVLVFGSPQNRRRESLAESEAFSIAVDFFRKLAEAAGEGGPCFCIEPNAEAYGCDFIIRVDQARDLVRAVHHPSFGLHVDAGTMALNQEPGPDLLRSLSGEMRHFHISEPHLRPTTEGRTPHFLLGRALRESGYAGWVSIEMLAGAGPSNPETARECLRFAQKAYGFASPDGN